jgi:glycosyltransferase involved in cell wall biosynthesis
MKLSVITPTSGNVLRVKDTINSFLAQRLDDYNIEINIIENSKKENQSSELKNYFKSLPKCFKYSLDERPGSSEVRNRAVQNTDGDVVAFIDDDVKISDTWIKTVYQSFEERKNLTFLGGTNLPNFTSVVPSWFHEFVKKTKNHWECHFLSLLEFNQDIENIDPKYIWGLNSAIVRKKFIELGGYNPDRHAYNLSEKKILRWAGDGDMGLAKQIKKYNLISMYKKKMLVYHLCNAERLTEKYFLDRSYMEGIINSYTLIRNSKKDINYTYKKNLIRFSLKMIAKKIINQTKFFKPNMVRELKKNILNAYIEGFKFHQKEALEDKKLINWIKSENYWNRDIRNEIR